MECGDIDECMEDAEICGGDLAGFCFNSVGAYSCVCNGGFALSNRTCFDIDECDMDPNLCSDVGQECLNSYGSYSCGCAAGQCLKWLSEKFSTTSKFFVTKLNSPSDRARQAESKNINTYPLGCLKNFTEIPKV